MPFGVATTNMSEVEFAKCRIPYPRLRCLTLHTLSLVDPCVAAAPVLSVAEGSDRGSLSLAALKLMGLCNHPSDVTPSGVEGRHDDSLTASNLLDAEGRPVYGLTSKDQSPIKLAVWV